MARYVTAITNKYKNMQVAAKAAVWYMICSVIQKGIAVITTPVFTRLLSTDEFGLYSVYTNWVSLASIFISLRLDFTVFNKGMSKFRENRDGYVASMQITTSITSVLCLVLYILFSSRINIITELSTPIMLLVILRSSLYPSYNFWMLRERYEYKYVRFIAIVLLLTIANAGTGIIAVLTIKRDGGLVRIVTDVVIYAVIGACLYYINFKKGLKNARFEHIKFALLFNLPLIPHYLSAYLLNNVDRFMIQKMVGMVETAIYGIAYSAGMVMNIVSTSLTNAMTPWYYEQLEKKNFESVKKVFLPIMVCLTGVTFLLLLFAPEFMYVLAPKEYYDAIYIIPPIAASVIFQVMYSFFSISEFYYDANKFSMFITTFAALFNVSTNYIFILKFGYLAAGFTTLFCNIIIALGHYIYAKKKLVTVIPGNFFDARTVFSLCILVPILVAGMCMLYPFCYVRFGIAIIGLILLISFRRQIAELFSSISKKQAKDA